MATKTLTYTVYTGPEERTVYDYFCRAGDPTTPPNGATLLCAITAYGEPDLWWLTDAKRGLDSLLAMYRDTYSVEVDGVPDPDYTDPACRLFRPL